MYISIHFDIYYATSTIVDADSILTTLESSLMPLGSHILLPPQMFGDH